MKIFITGATGFVGSWLVDKLLDEDAQISVLIRDFDPQSELIRSGNIEKVNVVNGSIEDFATVERAINEYEPEAAIHLAAQPLVGMSLRNPLHTFEANIRGTYNLLEACREHKNMLKSIVIASSDKAYGKSEVLPYTEETKLSACYPYEVSKSCADMLAQTYYGTYGLPVAVSRCGNIYGGGDLNWSRIVPGTIKSLYFNQNPIIRSNGKFLRDYIYIQDAVLALMDLVAFPELSRGEVFNFGTDEPTSVLDIVRMIQELMGKEYLEPQVLNEADREIKDQYLSSVKAHKMLDWNTQYTLNTGLALTIEWYDKYFWRMSHGRA